MVELSGFNIEKLMHSFVRQLTFKVSPVCNKRLDKINFTSYIEEDACHVNLKSPRIGEKSHDIATSILDIADVQNVHHFIERQTRFLDKFVYSKNIPLLTYYFNRINQKIMQKVQKDVINDEHVNKCAKKHDTKCKNKSPNLKQNANQSSKDTLKINISDEKMSTLKYKDLLVQMESNYTMRRNLKIKSITECIRREVELNERYLQLYINNVEFIKRNVHITLYINNKTLSDVKYCSDALCFMHEKNINYQRTLMLCKHAILCLIEPSKKASVRTGDNLSIVIQNYLSQGCIYHFNFTSNVQNCYSALVILSKWAKPLVRHPDITMLRAISAVLKCSVYDILVLSHQLDNDSLQTYILDMPLTEHSSLYNE